MNKYAILTDKDYEQLLPVLPIVLADWLWERSTDERNARLVCEADGYRTVWYGADGLDQCIEDAAEYIDRATAFVARNAAIVEAEAVQSVEVVRFDQQVVVLSAEEEAEFVHYDSMLRRGWQDVGTALWHIRTKKLYRKRWHTFEAYCADALGMSDERARLLWQSAQVMCNLMETPTIVGVLPANEAQARPLARLTADEQAPAWARAVEIAEERSERIVARHVTEAVKERTAPTSAPTPCPLPADWAMVGKQALAAGCWISMNSLDGSFAIRREGGFDPHSPPLHRFAHDRWADCVMAVAALTGAVAPLALPAPVGDELYARSEQMLGGLLRKLDPSERRLIYLLGSLDGDFELGGDDGSYWEHATAILYGIAHDDPELLTVVIDDDAGRRGGPRYPGGADRDCATGSLLSRRRLGLNA